MRLFGHHDTVPAHPDDAAPHIDGHFVVGLGASDMKCGLAVMQLLAERLDRAKLPFNLVYVMYEREEGPYLENGLGPLFEARPDSPGSTSRCASSRATTSFRWAAAGRCHAHIQFTGKSAHSARPWQGENAIHKAGPLLTRLLALAPVDVEIGIRFREVINATLAHGGRARNVIPEAMTLNLNYRFAPNESLEQAQADVRLLVAGEAEVEFTDLAPAGPVFAHHPLLKRLQGRTGWWSESEQSLDGWWQRLQGVWRSLR